MIYFDTNVLVYYLEDHPEFGAASKAIILKNSKNLVILSELVRQEVLGGAALHSQSELNSAAQAIEQLDNCRFLPVTKEVSLKAVELTLRHGRKVIGYDAIHLATALLNNVDVFYTNDRDLLSIKQIDSLKILPLA